MKIAVFGLGYVGCVTAACFTQLGHDVIGIDIIKEKIEKLRRGEAPIDERGLNKLLSIAIKKNKIHFTSDIEKAVMNSEIGFICVATPSDENGNIDLSFIKKICLDIAYILKKNNKNGYIIVIRSSIIPGTIEKLEKIIKKKYALDSNGDYYLVENPEFLREGSAIRDFMNPPSIVIGCENKEIAKKIAALYIKINAPVFLTDIKTAEMIKYVNNSFHALKVVFANEISSICKELKIDSKKLMEIFCSDNILNISDYYLKPGFAYGGSCLPKDLSALNCKARELKIKTPVLSSISKSNKEHILRIFHLIEKTANRKKTKKIGIFGLSFKSGTDDIRGSPVIYLISNLLKKNFNIKVYDPLIKKEQIYNILSSYRKKIYDPISETKNLKHLLPKICDLMAPSKEIIEQDIIILVNKIPEIERLIQEINKDKVIIDLKGVIPSENLNCEYLRIY